MLPEPVAKGPHGGQQVRLGPAAEGEEGAAPFPLLRLLGLGLAGGEMEIGMEECQGPLRNGRAV